jgi:MoaA/NifB/PqqE/SkfB family radical SAM enzyme
VRAAIESAGDAEIVLGGGEPALNPRLLDYVRLARGDVAIETNGVAFADPVFADALRDAGLKRARVGLHGSDESISSSITRAPGTWAKTLLGLDHLHQRSIELTIAIRLCAANVDDVERIVALARTRWPGSAIELAPVIDDDRHAVPHDALIALLERLPREIAIAACLPPCVSRLPIASVVDGVKVAACLRCRRERECGGVPRAYGERYGIAALVPET